MEARDVTKTGDTIKFLIEIPVETNQALVEEAKNELRSRQAHVAYLLINRYRKPEIARPADSIESESAAA